MNQFEKDLRELAAKRKKMRVVKSDERELKKPLTTKGKLQKKRGKANSKNNHNKPRGFTRLNKSFTNYLARLGCTDEETKEYYRTGKLPARLKKEDQ